SAKREPRKPTCEPGVLTERLTNPARQRVHAKVSNPQTGEGTEKCEPGIEQIRSRERGCRDSSAVFRNKCAEYNCCHQKQGAVFVHGRDRYHRFLKPRPTKTCASTLTVRIQIPAAR